MSSSTRRRSATPLLALAAGTAVANIYYAQPLLPTLAGAFAAAPREVGLVATAAQVGFGTGLLLFVPLGDALERRGLILRLLAASARSGVAERCLVEAFTGADDSNPGRRCIVLTCRPRLSPPCCESVARR